MGKALGRRSPSAPSSLKHICAQCGRNSLRTYGAVEIRTPNKLPNLRRRPQTRWVWGPVKPIGLRARKKAPKRPRWGRWGQEPQRSPEGAKWGRLRKVPKEGLNPERKLVRRYGAPGLRTNKSYLRAPFDKAPKGP